MLLASKILNSKPLKITHVEQIKVRNVRLVAGKQSEMDVVKRHLKLA